MRKPLVTVIIPVRGTDHPEKAIDSLSRTQLDGPPIQIIVVEGSAPAWQRNNAVAQAEGEIIYFLDDDSYVEPDTIAEGLRYFEQGDTAAVGGPAVTHDQATFAEECFGSVIGTVFGALMTRARNVPIGEPRRVEGEELITCNLMIRKSCFNQVGGMDLRFFPGEEVAILRRLRALNLPMYYSPNMVVHRTRRKSLGAFAQQMISYGKVRSQILFNSKLNFGDIVYFAPTMLICYLLALFAFASPWLLAPLALYLICALSSSLWIGLKNKSLAMTICTFPLFPILHLTYGVGFALGVFMCMWGSAKATTCPIRMTEMQLVPQFQTDATLTTDN